MSTKRRIIRRIIDSESDDDDQTIGNHATVEGGTEGNEVSELVSDSDSDNDSSASTPYSSRSPSEPPSIPEVMPEKRLNQEAVNREARDRMERKIAYARRDTGPITKDDIDRSWRASTDVHPHRGRRNLAANIRLDLLKPFPSGIPVNSMWEHWNRYVERFEIAATFSRVFDRVDRTQLLYLAMGDELQDIVNAVNLRPILTSSSCYADFVSNIRNHLRSMTDSSAEQESFARMKQEAGESAVAFHARLMGKIKSCNYTGDEDKFVRIQLLAGLRNRELVKQARTYAYDTNFIVQSATRSEAFEPETKPSDEYCSVLEIRNNNRRPPNNEFNRNAGNSTNGPPAKRQRNNGNNWQSQGRKCNRCSLFTHRNGVCPALERDCRNCGKRGPLSSCLPRTSGQQRAQHTGL